MVSLLAPHKPKAAPKNEHSSTPQETILRVHTLRQWYALSAMVVEAMLNDNFCMQRLAGIELSDGRIPDVTTILSFRHLLATHEPTEKLFAEVNSHLADQNITLRLGTLLDTMIIGAPSST